MPSDSKNDTDELFLEPNMREQCEEAVTLLLSGIISKSRVESLFRDYWNNYIESIEERAPGIKNPTHQFLFFLVSKKEISSDQAWCIMNGLKDQIVLGNDCYIDPGNVLGTGGFATVYAGMNSSMMSPIAVKLLNKGLPEEHLSSVLRGSIVAQALSDLGKESVNLPEVTNVRLKPRPHCVMRLIKGQSLDKVSPAELSEEDIVNILHKVAMTLDLAHSKGVVHRDVKPNNILRKENGTPVLIDWDTCFVADTPESKVIRERLAKSAAEFDMDSLKDGDAPIGTGSYIAPEILLAKEGSTPDPRSDMYSLACTLYFLSQGSSPQPGGGNVAKMMLDLEENVPLKPLPDDAPDRLKKLYACINDWDFRSRLHAKEFAEKIEELYPELKKELVMRTSKTGWIAASMATVVASVMAVVLATGSGKDDLQGGSGIKVSEGGDLASQVDTPQEPEPEVATAGNPLLVHLQNTPVNEIADINSISLFLEELGCATTLDQDQIFRFYSRNTNNIDSLRCFIFRSRDKNGTKQKIIYGYVSFDRHILLKVPSFKPGKSDTYYYAVTPEGKMTLLNDNEYARFFHKHFQGQVHKRAFSYSEDTEGFDGLKRTSEYDRKFNNLKERADGIIPGDVTMTSG